MFTQNYYNLLANLTAADASVNSSDKGLPYISVSGVPIVNAVYFNGFPSKVVTQPTIATNLSSLYGTVIGTGSTPPTLADIDLESRITSGVSVSQASAVRGVDSAPYLEITISITNTDSSELTVREVGFIQQVYYGSSSSHPVLFDRTVLETPLVIQPGDAGILKYRLESIPAERTKEGVKLVPFTCGSDEEIAAMIDAANEGLIDLQADGLWRVGDYRTIHIDSWVGGGSTSHSAQNVDIIITQFGDYNECGCVMQFDFKTLATEAQRMNATNTNVGGYGASEMFSDTLPALVNALPTWLKNRLKTFSVVVGKGNVDEVETVGGNKLALRSPTETDDTYGKRYSASDEGSIIEFYRSNGYNSENKKKTVANTSSSTDDYWYRSPAASNATSFVEYYNSSATGTYISASTPKKIAPFGCL